MKLKTGLLKRKTLVCSNNKTYTGFIKRNLILGILLISGVLLFPQILSGQCDEDIFLDKYASNLGTYNYIKSFAAFNSAKKKAKSEYLYVFSKGSTYKMIACSEENIEGKMAINLYDSNHVLIASTYDEKTRKNYPELLYPCSATGVYYIRPTIEGVKKGCGLCILGFSKD